MNTTTTPTDIQSLIGQTVSSEYIHQEREREILEAAASDFSGYSEWSIEVEDAFSEGDVENFHIVDGAIFHKAEPQRGPFIAGIAV
ncbi:MAG: hypothetical protein AB1631_10240 [Acidobacteriota bacterium]